LNQFYSRINFIKKICDPERPSCKITKHLDSGSVAELNYQVKRQADQQPCRYIWSLYMWDFLQQKSFFHLLYCRYFSSTKKSRGKIVLLFFAPLLWKEIWCLFVDVFIIINWFKCQFSSLKNQNYAEKKYFHWMKKTFFKRFKVYVFVKKTWLEISGNLDS